MPWDPIRDLREWQERLASHHAESWAPPTDVYETAEAYVITLEVPGLQREQIDLSLEGGRLVIRGRRPDLGARAGKVLHFHQIERGHGPFARTVEFAEKVDGDRVSADLSNGVLTITVPKLPKPPPRRIEVR
jgi:HSP20 family protein